jgi:hypothetical protein
MSPTNSIWRDAPYLMKYIERCQKMLQWGQPDNDFLIYLPVHDMWKKNTQSLLMMFDIHSIAKKAPEFIKAVMEIDSLGFGYDYISDRQLAKVKKTSEGSDGERYITEGGTVYKGIIDPRKPINTALLNRKASPEELQTRLNLRYIRRSNPYGWHYFIVNLTPDDVDSEVKLTVPFKEAIWYNPLTDEYTKASTENGKVRVNLLSGESRFLIVSRESNSLPACTAPTPVLHRDAHSMTITTPWKLAFTEETPKVAKTWTLDRPQTWEALDDDSVKVTMGTGVYTTTIKLNKNDAKKHWAINLGDVRESARVYINGTFIGCAWSAPFILDTKGLPANRIADLDRHNVPWRKMKEINVVNINYKKTTYAGWSPVKSGLNSDVKLMEFQTDEGKN